MATRSESVGDVLRDWRSRRRYSQIELAGEAEISTRHLSFVESGRAAPSRDMLLRLSESLHLTLRERNRLLLSAGYAPIYGERPLSDADMAEAREAVETVLRAYSPFPALAVDRHWNLVSANEAAEQLLVGVAPALLAPPINVLRASLHPNGLAKRIVNLAEWRRHLLARLRDDVERSGDPILAGLHDELRSLPAPRSRRPPTPISQVAVPLIIRDPADRIQLSFLSTTTVFGTAVDVTLAELTLECFLPVDAVTRAALIAP